MPNVQRLSCLFIVFLVAGCQGVGYQDPLGREPAPLPVACSWPRDGDAPREEWLRAAIATLEARNFTIRNTDVELGVVSAERTTRLPGLGAVDRPWFGGSALWGSLGRSSGIGIGYGVRFGDDPVQIERLSVVVDDDDVRITRDSSVVDPGGYLVDARPDNRAGACRELSESIAARVRAEESRQ